MLNRRFSRRRFVSTAGSALVGAVLGPACTASSQSAAPAAARLSARPHGGVRTTLVSGPLGLGTGGRDGVIQIPTTALDGNMPLLVFLHGATQTGSAMLRRIGPAADQAGVAILAPDSRGTSWDAIRGDFGEDVTFLNRALEFVFDRLAVDPARVALGGFSDGASVRALGRPRQRRTVPARHGVLAGIHHPGTGARPSTLLRLARPIGSDSSHRPVQSGHRPASAHHGL